MAREAREMAEKTAEKAARAVPGAAGWQIVAPAGSGLAGTPTPAARPAAPDPAAAPAQSAPAMQSVPAAHPAAPAPKPASPFIRAANEDDDGYDPYSDRPARTEPLFERDPWS